MCAREKKTRGVAIELAIAFTAISFALSMVLITVAFSTRIRDKNLTGSSNNNFVLDQIGEYFVLAVRGDTDAMDKLALQKKTSRRKKTSYVEQFGDAVHYRYKDNDYLLKFSSGEEKTEINKTTNRVTKTCNHTMYVHLPVYNSDGSIKTTGERAMVQNDEGVEIPASDGSGNPVYEADLSGKVVLTVTVNTKTQGKNITYNVTNWSDQSLEKDVPAYRHFHLGWLLLPLLVILLAVAVIVLTLIILL